MRWADLDFAPRSSHGLWWLITMVAVLIVIERLALLDYQHEKQVTSVEVPLVSRASEVPRPTPFTERDRQRLSLQVQALNIHLARLGVAWPTLMSVIAPDEGIRLEIVEVDADRRTLVLQGVADSTERMLAYQRLIQRRQGLQQLLLTHHEILDSAQVRFTLEALWQGT